ncbi:MAG: carboxypeptidase-like regulatory domain-containing protein [Candidatus Parabeggiatoa sp.]|nr:carboxypeptidase-like regulatory domain-containing protein [Candidatus Parabeggiatoa sp.]
MNKLTHFVQVLCVSAGLLTIVLPHKVAAIVCLGEAYEPSDSVPNASYPSVTITNTLLTVEVGEILPLSAKATVDVENGGTISLYWCGKRGDLASDANAPDYSTVNFIAPSEPGPIKMAVHVRDGLGYIDIDTVTLNVLPRTRVVKGYVRDASQKPIAEATIHIGDFTATTDAAGYWEIVGLPGGTYTVMPSKQGHHFTAQTVTLKDDETNTLELVSEEASECLLYAVHDEGRNHSLFFTVDVLNNFDVKLLGSLYHEHDIESLAIHPTTNQLFAVAGKDGLDPGYLYSVNATTGAISPIGDTGFRDINGLSFKLDDNTLWGWAKGDGLIKIDISTAKGTLQEPYNGAIEDITWNNAGTILYGVMDNRFLAYHPQTKQVKALICTVAGEIEALEMMPADNELLFSMHNDNSLSIRSINIDSCQEAQVRISTALEDITLNDVEGIALPKAACTD